MTIEQAVLENLRELPTDKQQEVLDFIQFLKHKLSQIKEQVQEKPLQNKGDSFWQGVLRFRETIEREGIEFTDEDFENLRDRSPGREIEL